MTRNEFEECYGSPWTIEGTSLDSCPCIFTLYRTLQMQTKTREEMIQTAQKFGFFSNGALTPLRTVPDESLERVRSIWSKGNEAVVTDEEMENLGCIILPPVMLHAAFIGKKFGLPEFYAGLQYMRANYPFKEENKND